MKALAPTKPAAKKVKAEIVKEPTLRDLMHDPFLFIKLYHGSGVKDVTPKRKEKQNENRQR